MSDIACPDCGTINDVILEHCQQCGAPLDPDDPATTDLAVFTVFSKTEISLILACVELRGQGDTSGLLRKLAYALAKASAIEPNDVTLQFSEDEAFNLHLAVDIALGDAAWADALPRYADEVVGNIRLSELAKYSSTLRDISRRLLMISTLAEHQKRIAELEARVEALEKEWYAL